MSNANINTFVKVPNKYDAVVLDKNNNIKFIKRETYNDTILDQSYTRVGAIYEKRGGVIDIVYLYNYNWYLHEYLIYKLSNYILDGTDRTGSIKIYNQVSDKEEEIILSYNAINETDFVTQLNTYFSMTSPFKEGNWSASFTEGNDYIDICFINEGGWQQRSYTKSGVTLPSLTLNIRTPKGIEFASSLQRMQNFTSNDAYCIISCYPNARDYYFHNDTNTTVFNPTTEITENQIKQGLTRIYCLPAYLGTSTFRDKDYCKVVREKFGEGYDGWINYLHIHFPTKYSLYFAARDKELKNGLIYTKILAEDNVILRDGAIYPAFKAAKQILDIEFNNTLLSKGHWHLPSVHRLYTLLENIIYNKQSCFDRSADPLNEILYKMNGDAINGQLGYHSVTFRAAEYVHQNSFLGTFGYSDTIGKQPPLLIVTQINLSDINTK